jgi:hypothetical protein
LPQPTFDETILRVFRMVVGTLHEVGGGDVVVRTGSD